MATFEIERNGQVFEVEAPDQATALQAFSTYQPTPQQAPDPNEIPTPGAPQQPPVEKQRWRSAVQGWTAGLGDEIAGAGMALNNALNPWNYDFGEGGPEPVRPGFDNFKEDYETYRDDERAKLDAYRQAHPGEAMAYEVGGGIAPAILSLGQSAPATVANLAKSGAGWGGAAGFGYSEESDPGALLQDTAGAAVTGAIAGPLVGKVLGGAGNAIRRIKDRFGNKVSAEATTELTRLMEMTGKSADEVIQDIADGAVMAENKTLTATVKAMKNQGGQAADTIIEQVPMRAGQTRARAQNVIREGLDIGDDAAQADNVLKYMRASDDALGQMESQSYNRVFQGADDVGVEVIDQARNVIRSNPEIRGHIEKLYGAQGKTVPPFKTGPDGSIDFFRQPTLEDMEIIRRGIRDKASEAFRAGSGDLGTAYKGTERALKNALDDQFPELADTRALASARRGSRDAYEEARKRGMTMSPDEFAVEADKLAGTPGRERAMRAGMASAVDNKMARTPSAMAQLADPERLAGMNLRTALPAEAIPGVDKATQQAADAYDMYNKVMHNSMTAGTQSAESQLPGMLDVVMAKFGSPQAVMSIMNKVMGRAPQMSDKARNQVAKLLFEQDPKVVKAALDDPLIMSMLVERLAKAGSGGAALQAAPSNKTKADR